jgi:hypothetical protein
MDVFHRRVRHHELPATRGSGTQDSTRPSGPSMTKRTGDHASSASAITATSPRTLISDRNRCSVFSRDRTRARKEVLAIEKIPRDPIVEDPLNSPDKSLPCAVGADMPPRILRQGCTRPVLPLVRCVSFAFEDFVPRYLILGDSSGYNGVFVGREDSEITSVVFGAAARRKRL